MEVFENKKPTETERELFQYAGFYKVESNEHRLRYVPIHVNTKDGFPKRVETEPKYIEYKTSITFFNTSETIDIVGSFDGKLIKLIGNRMKELGWQI